MGTSSSSNHVKHINKRYEELEITSWNDELLPGIDSVPWEPISLFDCINWHLKKDPQNKTQNKYQETIQITFQTAHSNKKQHNLIKILQKEEAVYIPHIF